MAITAKGLATRQRIIEGTAEYLRSGDPGEVTLDDIRAITGTSKSQIFHYFPAGKDELLLAAARHEAARVLDDQQPHLSSLNSWAAWTRWRNAVLARYRAQGRNCPLGMLMAQIGSTPGAAEVVFALLEQWQADIRLGIAQMQAAGLVRPRLDPDRVSAAFIAGIQGGVQVLRSTGSTRHLEAALDTLIDHLHGDLLDLQVQKLVPSITVMTRRLENKTALVTGSTSNIGRQIAVAFGSEGAHVVVSGRDDTRGQAVVARIRDAGGKSDYVHADLDGAATSRTLAQEAAGLLGGSIDILVNNAGIFPHTSTLATDEETFDRVYAVNVKSAFFLTQALVPAMISAGGGTIINLGSWIARLGIPAGALYSSTKGAVETMTRAWAAEFGPQGIRVNAISPGVIQPEDWDPAAEYPGAVFMRSAPAGTPGHPEAIAAAAVYLASDDAAFVHGAVLDIDGGRANVLTSSAR